MEEEGLDAARGAKRGWGFVREGVKGLGGDRRVDVGDDLVETDGLVGDGDPVAGATMRARADFDETDVPGLRIMFYLSSLLLILLAVDELAVWRGSATKVVDFGVGRACRRGLATTWRPIRERKETLLLKLRESPATSITGEDLASTTYPLRDACGRSLPAIRVLEDVCDPPGARDAHGLAFLCIRAYIRSHFVSRA